MKNIIPILSAIALLLLSCSQSTLNSDSGVKKLQKPLFARMFIANQIQDGDPVMLKFVVYNQEDSVQQFCKWHTPFEPLMSKYLEIKTESSQEVTYKGPMAKRIMPPPADSYLKVKPGDSLVVEVDLVKAYDIKEPGKYRITYTGQGISGLIVKDSVSFVYSINRN